ncbi:DUF6580 family putative transport protein [Taibaiella helva]|uniref:DUF6580 family putative transport protein n=1 Tax=Taibaiella helva TaxID=2301235 RepID=UPI000E57ADB3|nr:DUF6580 family putative transport protein [Taibaiella helva]
MKEKNNLRIIFLCAALILVAAISRIVNAETHWYNFGPLVAISLFSGAILKNKTAAYLMPLAAYFLSDLYLQLVHHNGFYGVSQFFVYGGMVLVVFLGTLMRKVNALKVLGFTIGGSLLFWLISNFGVFVSGYYGPGLSGLSATYLAAIPFYNQDGVGTELFFNAIIGDLIFSGVLFGAYALLKNKVTASRAIAR